MGVSAERVSAVRVWVVVGMVSKTEALVLPLLAELVAVVAMVVVVDSCEWLCARRKVRPRSRSSSPYSTLSRVRRASARRRLVVCE